MSPLLLSKIGSCVNTNPSDFQIIAVQWPLLIRLVSGTSKYIHELIMQRWNQRRSPIINIGSRTLGS